MNKKIVAIISFSALLLAIISLYTTFAYNEEAAKIDNSSADYNLIYALKNDSKKSLSVSSKEEVHIDLILTNPYNSTVKYGMYYYMENPKKMPQNVSITLAKDSIDSLESTIKSGETKSVSLKITNNSNYNIELSVGALVGFENGNIEDLIQEGEILIK